MATDHNKPAPAPTTGGINTGVAIVGFALSFLAGGGLMWAYASTHGLAAGGEGGGASGAAWSDEESPIPVSSKDPIWGNRTALVTIVEFSDFQCPFCSRVEPTMDQVRKTYGPDQVRIVWKNLPLPFHQNAKPAAEAAQLVYAAKGSEAFWKFHDKAFANQQALTADNFVAWAKELGVTDSAKFRKDLDAHTAGAKVEADAEIAKKAGVNGTPGFMINGKLLSGAQPFDAFKKEIDSALEAAKAKVASGTPKDKVYVAVTKDNFKAAPQKPEEAEEKEDTTIFKVPVGTSPFQGPKDALVTMVLFSDFQCPFCKRVEDTLKKVRETYPTQVRIVWKHEPLPFHPRAEPAAELAEEARAQKGDAGFWAAHAKLFEMQPKLEDADLEQAAKDLGLNVGAVKDAIAKKKHGSKIQADADLADDVQASGTPHFFINGRRLVGAQPFEKFKAVIDDEVSKAKALVEKGTPAAGLYDAIIKDGKGAPEMEKKTLAAAPATSPFKGGANAKVVIQQFSDFQCPFCSRVEPTIDEIMAAYGDRVKLVWRNLPLPMHPDAPLAAEAAAEAQKQKGNAGFWAMHKKLFENQRALGRENLEKFAGEIGLDLAKFKAALDSHVHKASVDADAKAAGDAQIGGTPAFVINGYFVSGAQPAAKFKKVIEKALAEAK
jgi:protein-disulfide isomerase